MCFGQTRIPDALKTFKTPLVESKKIQLGAKLDPVGLEKLLIKPKPGTANKSSANPGLGYPRI